MRPDRKGFILIYAIVMLCLMSVFMAVVAQGTKTIVQQTNRAQLAAIERNLRLSALAWAEHRAAPVERTALDVNDLTSRPAGLDLAVRQTAAGLELDMTGWCRYGPQSLKETVSLPIPEGARPSQENPRFSLEQQPPDQ